MDQFALYRMDESLRLSLNLPDSPFPVRKNTVSRVFGDKSVALELLVDEMALFLHEFPQYSAHYSSTLGLLSYIAGTELGRQGKTEAAIRCFEAGLSHEPDNLSLRSNYAIALHSSGRFDEALTCYQSIIQDPDIGVSPVIWVLAARLLERKRNFSSAYRLLMECLPLMSDDEDLQRFSKELKQKVMGQPAMADDNGQYKETGRQDGRSEGTETAPNTGQEKDAKRWYYLYKGKERGPISETDLQKRLNDGIISPETPVWHAGLEGPKRAGEILPGSAWADDSPRRVTICSQCQFDLPESARFCPACGSPVPQPASGEPGQTTGRRFCTACGAKVQLGKTFCSACGMKIRPGTPKDPQFNQHFAPSSCPNCGTLLPPTKRFCTACGTPVKPPGASGKA